MEQRYLVSEVARTHYEIGPIVAGGVLWVVCFAALVKGGIVSSQFTGVVVIVVVISWFLFGAISYFSCKVDPRGGRVGSAQESLDDNDIELAEEMEVIEDGRASSSSRIQQIIRGLITTSPSRQQIISNAETEDNIAANPPEYKDINFASVVVINSDIEMTSSNSSSDTPPPVYEEAIMWKQSSNDD